MSLWVYLLIHFQHSPPATGSKSSVMPSNVPHETAASGEEYAVTTKAVSKQQQQQPPTEEYAVVDKDKKKAAASQGVSILQQFCCMHS